jgi:hypothetical protein
MKNSLKLSIAIAAFFVFGNNVLAQEYEKQNQQQFVQLYTQIPHWGFLHQVFANDHQAGYKIMVREVLENNILTLTAAAGIDRVNRALSAQITGIISWL